MKWKINIPLAISLGSVLVSVLSGAGCASSGTRSAKNHDTQCLTGVAQQNSAESLVPYSNWGISRGSIVSPLGDAPGESDLQVTRESQTPCVGCNAAIAQAGVAR